MFGGVRAVLFDLDGTLIDSAPDLAAAADQMRTSRGLPSLPLAAYRHMAGAGARGMLGVAFGISPQHADYERLRDEFFSNYEACMTQRTHIFEGVEELIRQIGRTGRQWAVVTNKQARFTDPLTRAMPLFDTARTIVSGDTTPTPKPHPAPLLLAASRLGMQPHECIYVGDDERDIQAGRAAGMPTVAATYGYLGSAAEVGAWGADALITTPLALLDLLHRA